LNDGLYFEEYGQSGHPEIIFLHGLLGSSRNWRSVAKALSGKYKIYALDLPEHGKSPHSSTTSLSNMSQRVGDWIVRHLKGDYILCGHSLGGKVAMAHACQYPHGLKGLVVGDIAPRDYPPEHHLPTLEALLGLNLSSIKSRKQADDELSKKITNWAFRQFLLTNLQEKFGAWYWRINLSTLHASMPELSCNPLQRGDQYDGPCLFVRGGKSGYVRSEHFSLVTQAFPRADIVTLPGAGHDVHVEDKPGFLLHLEEFLAAVF
jgi:esterase